MHTIQAAEHCLRQRQHMPALVLMYSLMDTLAWTAADAKRAVGVRRRFEAWISHWLLPHLQLTYPELTAVDLYAARCAVLHSMTDDSDLSRRGKAKRIVYAWEIPEVEQLKSLTQSQPGGSYIPLQYAALLSSLVWSADRFIKEASQSLLLSKRVLEASNRHRVKLDHSSDGI
jgi:hypothetical protein